RRAAGADGAAQMPGAELAGDLHREIGLDAAVHRLGIDDGVDMRGQTGADGPIDRGELDITARQRLHVRFDTAIDRGRLDGTGRGVHGDAAVDGRRLHWRADAVDLQAVVNLRRVVRHVVRLLNGNANRDVVHLTAVLTIVACVD